MPSVVKSIYCVPVLISLLAVSTVKAQNVPPTAEPERIEKKLEHRPAPRAAEQPLIIPKAEENPPQKLKGVRFLLHEVRFEGNTVFSQETLQTQAATYLSQNVSLADLYVLAEKVTAFYRNEGYVLSRAIIPAQHIRNGAVTVRVVEGYIDQVTVEGKIPGSRNLIRTVAKHLTEQRPLRQKKLERSLLLVKDITGFDVNPVLTPSEKNPGAAHLTLAVKRYHHLDAVFGFDNYGSRYNGPFRESADVNFHNLLGVQENTGVQFLMTGSPEETIFVHGHQEHFLNGEGTEFSLFAMYGNTQPGHTLEPLNVKGESVNTGFRFSHPWIRSRRKNWTTGLEFAFKHSQTYVTGSLSSRDRIRVVSLSSAYDFVDKLRGINLFYFKFSKGLDILFPTRTGSAFLTRARGQSDFTKIMGSWLRIQKVVPNIFLKGEAEGQFSFDHLLAFEEFGAGGRRFGRGYDSSEITGDHGFGGTMELQFIRDLSNTVINQLQLYSFFDSGLVWHKDAPDSESIYSAGGGLRLTFLKKLTGAFEVAKPLARHVEAEGNRDIRYFFSLRGNFDA